jgi:hypothetical protein
MPRRGGACLHAESRGRRGAQASTGTSNAEAGISPECDDGESPMATELWKRAAWGNRYRVDVAFDGAACAGWQTWQNSAAQNRTAHYQVQLVLRTVLRAAELELISAGRTDAGVHVLCMPCHFDLPLSRTLDLVALGNGAHLIRREPSSLHLSHSSSSSLRSSCKLLLLAAARNLPTSSCSCHGPAYSKKSPIALPMSPAAPIPQSPTSPAAPPAQSAAPPAQFPAASQSALYRACPATIPTMPPAAAAPAIAKVDGPPWP